MCLEISCDFGLLTSSFLAVGCQTNLGNPPPLLGPHYQASSLVQGGPPLRHASVLSLLQFLLLEVLPLATNSAGRSIGPQVLTFHTRA